MRNLLEIHRCVVIPGYPVTLLKTKIDANVERRSGLKVGLIVVLCIGINYYTGSKKSN